MKLPSSAKVSCERVDDAEPYLVILRFESGMVEIRTVETLAQAAELRSNAESGMSALVSAEIFVGLP